MSFLDSFESADTSPRFGESRKPDQSAEFGWKVWEDVEFGGMGGWLFGHLDRGRGFDGEGRQSW